MKKRTQAKASFDEIVESFSKPKPLGPGSFRHWLENHEEGALIKQLIVEFAARRAAGKTTRGWPWFNRSVLNKRFGGVFVFQTIYKHVGSIVEEARAK